jgi:hypothetical protein
MGLDWKKGAADQKCHYRPQFVQWRNQIIFHHFPNNFSKSLQFAPCERNEEWKVSAITIELALVYHYWHQYVPWILDSVKKEF